MKATTKQIITDNLLVTLNDLTNEIRRRYAVEKDAKNKAYSFIISMGLMDEFARFTDAYSNIEDPHEAAISMLTAEGQL